MASQAPFKGTDLFPYEAPAWAKDLKGVPTKKLKLGHLNTPIVKWDLPGVPDGFEVYIKRDDMTGSTLSGNKVRKLEFLLADALQTGCRHVITCGGLQSNHSRATALASTQLGLKPHLVLRAGVEDESQVGCSGNVLLDRLAGADIYTTPKIAQFDTELKPRMEKLAEKIRSETGEKSYLIPIGGSNEIGMWGYVNAFDEMLNQGLVEHFDDIIFACGSGGTAEGLAVANYLTKSNLGIHGVIVSSDKDYYINHISNTLGVIGLDVPKAEDMVDMIEGYKGKAYASTTPEELDYAVEVATKTGIVLDYTYTLKAVRGLVSELQNNPGRFKGKRILYLYTGGMFGLFDSTINQTLTREKKSATNTVHVWNDLNTPPF